MLAFHAKQEIKDFYVNRAREHAEADEIIKGTYWEGGKDCAVGCTLHSSSCEDYETELGIPIILARLEDRIFENLPNEEAKRFPLRFLNVIKPGADLSRVWSKFAVWLLADEASGVIRFAEKNSAKYIAIQRVVDLCKNPRWEKRDRDEFAIAAIAAGAFTAWAAAASDIYAAADAAAGDAARTHCANATSAQANKLIELLEQCE